MACVVVDTDDLLALFRLRFPEFSSVVDDDVKLFIDEAKTVFIQSTNGILYLAAHFVKLSVELGINTAATGTDDPCVAAVNMYKIGDITFQFKDITSKSKDNIFTSTEYGTKYLVFRNASQGYVSGGLVSC